MPPINMTFKQVCNTQTKYTQINKQINTFVVQNVRCFLQWMTLQFNILTILFQSRPLRRAHVTFSC